MGISLPPAQAIAALGGVLSSKPEPSPHMRRISTMLLGRQIIRPDGVDGLYAVVFGEEEITGDEAPLEKLEHISRVLTTVPPGTQPRVCCIVSFVSILMGNKGLLPTYSVSNIVFPVQRRTICSQTSSCVRRVTNVSNRFIAASS